MSGIESGSVGYLAETLISRELSSGNSSSNLNRTLNKDICLDLFSNQLMDRFEKSTFLCGLYKCVRTFFVTVEWVQGAVKCREVVARRHVPWRKTSTQLPFRLHDSYYNASYLTYTDSLPLYNPHYSERWGGVWRCFDSHRKKRVGRRWTLRLKLRSITVHSKLKKRRGFLLTETKQRE